MEELFVICHVHKVAMKTSSGTHLPYEGDVWPGVTESVSQPGPQFSELFPEALPKSPLASCSVGIRTGHEVLA